MRLREISRPQLASTLATENEIYLKALAICGKNKYNRAQERIISQHNQLMKKVLEQKM